MLAGARTKSREKIKLNNAGLFPHLDTGSAPLIRVIDNAVFTQLSSIE
jgi:hypothetical protein